MKKILIQIVGWIGVACVLGAYALVTLHVIEPSNIVYLVLNIIGSAGIICSSLSKRDLQPIVLNILWLLIAVIGLLSVRA